MRRREAVQSPAFAARRELDRRIIALAIPALGTLAIEPLYVLVDTAIVGRLGTPQLGGLAIAVSVFALSRWRGWWAGGSQRVGVLLANTLFRPPRTLLDI